MPVRRLAVLALALGGMLAPGHRPRATVPAAPDQFRGWATAADLPAAAGPVAARAHMKAAEAKPGGVVGAVAGRSIADEPPAGLSREDWGQIRGFLEKGRYHAASVTTPSEPPVLRASNPEQGYVTSFRPEGIEIASRPVPGTDWRLGVRVTGFGHEGDVRPLPAASPVAENERVEYRRGPVTEWYENRPAGLEQGFTIADPGTRQSRPLVLAMAVEGELVARVEAADEASFRDGAGNVRVRYAGLRAWDADRRTLRSWLEGSEGQLRVLVEAADARFPVTVDPSFVRQAKLTASDGAATDYFGRSVSVSGDTAVVGAHYDDTAGGTNAGSAYVFVRSGTVWTQQQKLTASDGRTYDRFGWSVSVSGDMAVIGAWNHRHAWESSDEGSAYVFVRSGATWSQQQELTASEGGDTFCFGSSVSVSGDTAVIGDPCDMAGGGYAGLAYVFVRSGAVWTQQQRLRGWDRSPEDNFGNDVSVSGDTVVVGADGDYTAGEMAGSAYVFVRSGTVWTEQQKLTASDGSEYDEFLWRQPAVATP